MELKSQRIPKWQGNEEEWNTNSPVVIPLIHSPAFSLGEVGLRRRRAVLFALHSVRITHFVEDFSGAADRRVRVFLHPSFRLADSAVRVFFGRGCAALHP
jgi:hypothetical protein